MMREFMAWPTAALHPTHKYTIQLLDAVANPSAADGAGSTAKGSTANGSTANGSTVKGRGTR